MTQQRIVILIQHNKELLGYKNSSKQWSLGFQGYVQRLETVDKAASRILKEHTGLELKLETLKSFDPDPELKGIFHLRARYEQIIPQEGKEARWIGSSKLVEHYAQKRLTPESMIAYRFAVVNGHYV